MNHFEIDRLGRGVHLFFAMKITLPLMIILSGVSTGFSQSLTDGDWTYTTNASSEAIITEYAGSGGSVEVPGALAGFPVTGFGEFFPVFGYGNSNVTSVTFPASVTNIAAYALYDSLALTNLAVSGTNANYASVGGVLFDKLVTKLLSYPAGRPGSYAIPDGVTSIAEIAFAKNSGLTGVTIPAGVTNIAANAFLDCGGLLHISLPDSVTSIGDSTFGNCTNLVTVTVGTGLADIGGPQSDPFSGCAALTAINVAADNAVFASIDGVLFSDDETTLLYYPYAKPAAYVVPASVTSIADGAFADSSALTSVTMSSGVQSIGNYAFGSCPVLTNVTIGSSVTSLGQGAFSGSIGLTSLTLPTSVTSLGDYIFSGCTGLTVMTIPANVSIIGIGAFEGCTAMTSIEVDAANAAFTSVAGVLFDEAASNLIAYPNAKPGAYTIPDGVTQITYGAFGPSPGLTTVAIPNSVTNMPSSAFGACSSLTNVTIGAWISQDFAYFYSGFGSVFPGSVSRVAIADGVSAIGTYAFANCTAMTSVSIPGSVTNIGNGAFIGCTALNTVSVPASVTGIGSTAFAYCGNMTSAVFSGSPTSIASDSFEGCGALESILFKGDAPADTAWTSTIPVAPTLFCLPGTAGWGPAFGSLVPQLFLPQAVMPSYGLATGFRFSWSGTGAIPMNVERTASLPANWSVVSSNNATSEYTDAAPPAGKAFYRAVLP